MNNDEFNNIMNMCRRKELSRDQLRAYFPLLTPRQAKALHKCGIPKDVFKPYLKKIWANRTVQPASKQLKALQEIGFSSQELEALPGITSNRCWHKQLMRRNISRPVTELRESFYPRVKDAIRLGRMETLLKIVNRTKNDAEKEACRRIKEMIDGAIPDAPVSLPDLSWASAEARIKLMDQYFQLKKEYSSFSSPERAALYGKIVRDIYNIQWSVAELEERGADILKDELAGIQFKGRQAQKSAGCVWISCKYFRENIFLHVDDLAIGDFHKEAEYRFEVVPNKTLDGEPAFKAINATSSITHKEVATGTVVVLANFSPPLAQPVIVKTSLGTSAQQIETELKKYNPVNLADLFNAYPAISHVKLKDYYFVPLSPCDVEITHDEISIDQDLWSSLNKTFYKHTAGIISEKEKAAWQIVIDETGSCNDYQYKESNLAPSVIMAVLIPPETSLPVTPYDFHTTDPRFEKDADQLRKTIVKHPDVIVLALQYSSGRPAQCLDSSVLGSDFHTQLWKNILLLALEVIAARNKGGQQREIYAYFEQVGQLTPELKNYFDTIVQDLAEKNETRRAWENIIIKPPVILPKNTHPAMGYPDALGHVFRNTGDDTPDLFKEILKRKNTFELQYHQKEFEILYSIVTLFGREPARALERIAGTPYDEIRQFTRLVLEEPVQNAWSRLSARQFDDACRAITGNISRRPAHYRSCAFILENLPENFHERLSDPGLLFMFNLNRLAAYNHAGDTNKAREVTAWLDERMKSADISSRFRYLALKADIYNNEFKFDKALETVDSVYDEALRNINVGKAMHIVGVRALTLALAGRGEDALEIISEHQSRLQELSDRERWAIYKANIFFDLAQLDNARRSLEQADNIMGEIPLQHAGNSKYYRQALVKIMAREASADRELLQDICELPAGTEHPFASILYWSIIAMKNAGLEYEELLTPFQNAIFNIKKSDALALGYISLSFYSQAVEDGLIKRNMDFEEKNRSVAGRIKALDNKLEPLRFNYL